MHFSFAYHFGCALEQLLCDNCLHVYFATVDLPRYLLQITLAFVAVVAISVRRRTLRRRGCLFAIEGRL